MASFNKVILAGNLTRDPQLKYLPNNTAVCDFGLAVNHRWRDKEGNQREDVCFVDIAAFGRQAEIINQYMTKGKPILIEGRLKLDQWTDKEGNKRSRHNVVLEGFTFLGSREGGGAGGGGDYGGAPAARGNEQRSTQAGGYDRGSRGGPPAEGSFARGGATSAASTGGYAEAAPAYDPGPDNYAQGPASQDAPPPRNDDIPF
jgi:single-strand DNA-binding protein